MKKVKVAILTQASPEIGYGHLTRCAKIAFALSFRGVGSHFILVGSDDNKIAASIAEKSAPVTQTENTSQRIIDAVAGLSPDAVLVDLRSRNLGFLKGLGISIITLDNYESGADLYINIRHKDFNKGGAEERNGLAYWALNKPERIKDHIENKISKVLISCGYTDPAKLTQPLLQYVSRFRDIRGSDTPTITCVVTSAFKSDIESELQAINPHVRILKDIETMSDELLETDLAITTGGNTTIEALSHGVPTIIVPVGLGNDELADELEEEGYLKQVRMLGENQSNGSTHFSHIYEGLKNMGARMKLNKACRGFDANGAPRIAEEICRQMERNL